MTLAYVDIVESVSQKEQTVITDCGRNMTVVQCVMRVFVTSEVWEVVRHSNPGDFYLNHIFIRRRSEVIRNGHEPTQTVP